MIENVADRAKGRDRTARVGVALFVVSAALVVAGALASACGGSATESPWPVEPEHLVTGPEGEEGRAPPRRDRRPDGGTTDVDAGPNVEP